MRQQFASPGVTVTESKMLHDPSLNIVREVDIVIEGVFDGEPMLVSIEVIERSRKADVTWVDAMVKKHSTLPTNRLLLVSQAGFSKTALIAVAREGGRVEALTPEVVEIDGQPVIKSFFVDSIRYNARECNLRVRSPNGSSVIATGYPDIRVFSAKGEYIGLLNELVAETIHQPTVAESLATEAHNHPERSEVQSFKLNIKIEPHQLYIERNDTHEMHLIVELLTAGWFKWEQTEVPLTLTRLGQRVFGAGHATIDGISAVWVGTTDEDEQTTTIAWQTVDKP